MSHTSAPSAYESFRSFRLMALSSRTHCSGGLTGRFRALTISRFHERRVMLRLFANLIIAAVALVHAPAARAYPDKTVRLVVGYPAGDTTDLAARVIAAALGDFFKQKFVVENHAGSNGTLAMARVGKADHDGHTLLVAPSTLAAVPSLYPSFAYQPLRDFVPIARFAYVHNVLVVGGNASKATTLRAFLDTVRSRPSRIVFASAGAGSPSHLA